MAMSLLRKEKQYARLFLSGTVNGIGDRFSQVALLSLVISLTGSGMAVGITMAIRVIPFLVFGPAGGMLASRISRKKLMVVTDIVRSVVAISLLAVHSKGDLWILYSVTFILAALEALYAPARKSSIPLLVSTERLLTVNSLEQVMNGLILIIGAFAGGIVSYWFGSQYAFVVNSVSFLIAGLTISTIKYPKQEIERVEEWAESDSPIYRDRSSFIYLLRHSAVLKWIIVFEICVSIVNGIDNVLISVYAVQEYGMGDLGIGFFYASLGAGLMLSFTLVRFVNTKLMLWGVCALIAEGVLLMCVSQSNHFIWACILYLALSLMSGLGNASLDTLIMNETPQRYHGMLFGMMATIGNTLIGCSMFGAGVALEYVEPRSLGWIGGAAFIIIGLSMMLAGRRFHSNEQAAM
ncbi:MFS transporter [Paenibacillus sediminis]|uniref:MFS family permease n=1 Tax=Paenibacillus sediminis TaxID=664909 RepID=A0ABS4H632_9BACL|nr:MFS transporter [Paenibacillus sediminis]MBP1937993.1 MFS family permease [Paenibacillus sediminis]